MNSVVYPLPTEPCRSTRRSVNVTSLPATCPWSSYPIVFTRVDEPYSRLNSFWRNVKVEFRGIWDIVVSSQIIIIINIIIIIVIIITIITTITTSPVSSVSHDALNSCYRKKLTISNFLQFFLQILLLASVSQNVIFHSNKSPNTNERENLRTRLPLSYLQQDELCIA